MRHLALLAVVAALAAALAGAQAAYPDRGHGRHKGQPVVFVQTNELDGNHIVVYDRARNGALSRAGTFATGGNGGAAAPGDESDRLASQGSLVLAKRHSLLIAVNAGSDTVSTFKVRGNRLQLKGVVASGGQFPASIAVHRDLVYVMNAGNTGIVQGFRIRGHRLRPIAGSARSLGLANGNPPNFLTSPGQVGFTPGGRKLIVTTKASDSHILVFRVRRDGTLSAAPVVNNSATPVPFAFTFSPQGRLVDGEAGMSTVTTYVINRNGTLTDPKSARRSDGALLDRPRSRLLLRDEHGQQQRERVPGRTRRSAVSDRRQPGSLRRLAGRSAPARCVRPGRRAPVPRRAPAR